MYALNNDGFPTNFLPGAPQALKCWETLGPSFPDNGSTFPLGYKKGKKMAAKNPKSFKLSYFDMNARAGIARLIFAISKVKYEDERIPANPVIFLK